MKLGDLLMRVWQCLLGKTKRLYESLRRVETRDVVSIPSFTVY